MIDPDKIPDHAWKQMNITREEFVAIQERQAEREKHMPPIGSEAGRLVAANKSSLPNFLK